MKKIIFYGLIFLMIQNLLATELILELVDVKNIALQGEQSGQSTVFVGETFRFKVSVKNASDQTGEIQINGIEKLNVVGKSTHSNITVINGKFVAENSYFYDAYPNSEGILEVGPAQVKQNGVLIKSNTIKFRSIKKTPDLQIQQPSDSESSENKNFGVECELIADKQTVFQGEPLTVVLKIKSFGQIPKIGMDNVNFQGFQVKDSEQPTRRQEMVKNRLYELVEKKFYLIPTKTGTFKIEPVKIVYQAVAPRKRRQRGFFDDDFFVGFFGDAMLEPHEVFSNSLSINVKSVNQGGGALDGVGKFSSFVGSVDKSSVLVNEAIALKLELEGEGNFEQIVAPVLQLDPIIKSYESKSEFSQDSAKGPFAGSKCFEYIIQIGRAGRIIIPSQKFKYFDTSSKTVKVLETDPIEVQVTQPAGEKVVSQSQLLREQPADQATKELDVVSAEQAQDIHFIEQEGLDSKGTHWYLPWWILLFLFLIPMFFYFGLLSKLLSLLGRSTHLKKFSRKKSLNKFAKEFETLKQKNRPEQMYYFFMNLLSKRFEIQIQELTHDAAIEKLSKLNWEVGKINDFLDFLNECASLHFITTHNKINLEQSTNLFKKGDYWTKLLTKN